MFMGFVGYLMLNFWGITQAATIPSQQGTGDQIVAFIYGALGMLFLSFFAGSLLLLIGGIPLPAALANYIAHDQVKFAFYIREISRIIRADKWGYFVSWVIVLGLAGVIYTITTLLYYSIVLCCFVFFIMTPLGFYLLLVAAVVFGQSYREGVSSINFNAQQNLPVESSS